MSIDIEKLPFDIKHNPERLGKILLTDKYLTLTKRVTDLESREDRILDAIKECFPLPECTDGHQLVSDYNYNKLVEIINDKER
tara:strand:- start:583 stop:831 length:249 start_codon:yes stop_codon:yes gene_type:complete